MKNDGRIWPIIIGGSIFLVFLLGVWTIRETSKSPVQESDIYMDTYQNVDAHVNNIINAAIDFDKKYNVKYVGEQLNTAQSVVKYQITDKNEKIIDNAKIDLILTRPDTHQFDIKLSNPVFENDLYVFDKITLPKEGRWNIMAKVTIGDNYRFYNLKADTRYKETFEY